jgi:superfamily II DNA or RNA helicase
MLAGVTSRAIATQSSPDYYVVPSTWTEPFIKGKRQRFDPGKTTIAEKSLIADATRNATIAAAVYRAHKAGRRTIVFIKQKKHSAKLRDAMLGMGIPSKRVIEYNGETSQVDRLRAKECPEGIVLIATYKFTAEGTNIPPLDTAVLAHPIYDPRQTVGRITRKVEGKPKPIVLDLWDVNSGSLASIAKKRWEFLRKLGATWKGEFR